MKIPFNLSDSHKLILRVLHEVDGLRFPELESVIEQLNSLENNLSSFIEWVANPPKPKLLFSDPQDTSIFRIPSDLETDLEGLKFVGLINVGITQYIHTLRNSYLSLTDEGKRVARAIAEERRVILRPQLYKSIFVACAFGKEEIDELYNTCFEPSCRELGYEPVRVDMSEPKQTITELILEGITEAACVIADLTFARPSVYFEVGYAHGLGVPLVLTCRKDHYRGKKDNARVHFDLEQFKISFWSKSEGGQYQWDNEMMPAKRLANIVPSRKQEN